MQDFPRFTTATLKNGMFWSVAGSIGRRHFSVRPSRAPIPGAIPASGGLFGRNARSGGTWRLATTRNEEDIINWTGSDRSNSSVFLAYRVCPTRFFLFDTVSG